MIRVKTQIFTKGNKKLGIPNKGGKMYVLNYRRGAKYSTTYPDRSQFTTNPFMKRIYQLDDQLYFFDATTLGNFKKNKEALINDIMEYILELTERMMQYPEGTYMNMVLEKRIAALEYWVEELQSVKAKWPLEKSIKKLKKKLLKLK